MVEGVDESAGGLHGGMLLPATRSGLGSFPSSLITLIGDAPMHHESLKAHSEYVEKLGDVNRPDSQYTFLIVNAMLLSLIECHPAVD